MRKWSCQLIYNRVRIFLSANMISVPFCNPPTDHDFPRKWFKLLGRDRKRREHDHDSRSLCLFARCKRAFISREDASVLTLPSSGKVSLFTGSASSHPICLLLITADDGPGLELSADSGCACRLHAADHRESGSSSPQLARLDRSAEGRRRK